MACPQCGKESPSKWILCNDCMAKKQEALSKKDFTRKGINWIKFALYLVALAIPIFFFELAFSSSPSTVPRNMNELKTANGIFFYVHERKGSSHITLEDMQGNKISLNDIRPICSNGKNWANYNGYNATIWYYHQGRFKTPYQVKINNQIICSIAETNKEISKMNLFFLLIRIVIYTLCLFMGLAVCKCTPLEDKILRYCYNCQTPLYGQIITYKYCPKCGKENNPSIKTEINTPQSNRLFVFIGIIIICMILIYFDLVIFIIAGIIAFLLNAFISRIFTSKKCTFCNCDGVLMEHVYCYNCGNPLTISKKLISL